MPRPRPLALACALAALAAAWLTAQNPAPPKPLEVVRLSDNLHVLIDPEDNGNVAVYVTPEGVVLIDAKFERHVPQLLEAVARITPLPVRYLLSTHHHDDHTGGNAALRARTGARILGHTAAARLMRDRKMPGPPEVTFDNRLSLSLGGRTIEAYHFGPAHTSGDAVYFLPAENAAHVGDLVELVGPYIDHKAGGSGAHFAHAVEQVFTLKAATWIPGHGKPLTPDTAQLYLADLKTALARAHTMRAQGVKKEDAMAQWNAEGLRYCCRTNIWKRSLPGLWDEMAR
jgi:cyclase